MNQETQDYINHLGEAFVDRYQIQIPVTASALETIVQRLGGTIEEMNNFDPVLEPTVCKTGENSFVLRIESGLPARQKRSALARELGHLILHMGYLISANTWSQQDIAYFRYFGRPEQEYQANAFAEAIFMPQHQYMRLVQRLSENNHIDPRLLAEEFDVTTAMAVQRGKTLGILQ